jgi:UDP-glucose 4-epimerase
MKILATGALGFIGSNLAERLLKEGHEVSILDNLHTGSMENIASIKDKVKVFELNSGQIGKTGEKYDVIFHNGIYSSSPMYKDNPHLVAKAIDEFISIMEYAKKNGSRVVFASTSSMYNGITPPHKEDIVPLVKDYYSEARIIMERLAKLYYDLHNVPVVGLRYFSVYGPHEKAKKGYANLVTQFLWEMLDGKAPLIFGDGSQTRDFTYVDDVVEANLLAMNYGKFGVFNVGNGTSTTLNEIVEKLNQKLGTGIKPAYQENKIKNYVQHTLADTSLAEKELGFRAKIAIDEGIERLIGCYK